MQKRKGEISLTTLITTILVLAGFVILFIVYSAIDWTGNVDREVCHQSVVYRGTAPSLVQSYVPLKCKTEKTCITSGLMGGECDEFENSKGVIKAKVKSKTDIEKLIAGEVVDCWSTMGEGKLSLFSEFLPGIGANVVSSSCVICSRIAYDEKTLSEKKIIFDELNVDEYMRTRAIPNKDISYYEFIIGKSPARVKIDSDANGVSIPEINKDKEGNPMLGNEGSYQYEAKISAPEKEIAVLFMQISAPSHGDVFQNTLIGTIGFYAASFRIVGPIATVKATGSVISKPFAWFIGTLALAAQHGVVEYNKYVTAGYCGDISQGDKARSGCSVVRVVDYDIDEIRKYCEVIESIP